MAKKGRFKFRFDVALSYAGQDRSHVDPVARAMQSLGLRVFYDKDHRGYLWGKNRSEFEKIYASDTVFVVPFISKHYVKREWTQWEFETAKCESQKRRTEFLLPVRIDSSRQFGLTDDHICLDADIGPEGVAQTLKEKLEAHYSTRVPADTRINSGVVLSLASRRALGLLVTSPAPMTVVYLRSFFPDIDWTKYIRQFQSTHLIQSVDGLIIPAKSIEQNLGDEVADFRALWIAKLKELSDYADCAVFLALHYIKEQRFDDAVLALASVAITLEPNDWIFTYIRIFEVLIARKKWRNLKPETRLTFHHGYGHCLAEIGRFDDARTQYQHLRRIGKRLNDAEAIGVALLNIGVTHHKSRDFTTATKWYEIAHHYGVEHQYPTLISHALHNLAQIKMDTDPQSAIGLLEQSIELKKANDDAAGIAASLQMLAVALAELREFKKALEHYDRAERIALDLGLLHLQSHLLNNKAHTLLQEDRRRAALQTFKRSMSIADAENFSDLQVRSREGISRIHFIENRFDEAETTMRELLNLANAAGLPEFEMTAHHGLWAVYSLKCDTKSAKRHFALLLRLARKHKAHNWIARAYVDGSRPIESGVFQRVDSQKLLRYIRAESRRNDDAGVGWLWYELALFDVDPFDAVAALSYAINSFHSNPNMINEELDAYEQLHVVHWNSGRFNEAIDALDSLARLAKERRIIHRVLAAIDQKGACLQELERYGEARLLHEYVAKRAMKMELDGQAVNSLHNLAECHRRLGEATVAITIFEEALVIATRVGDEESVIQIIHGKALTHEILNEHATAISMLKECKTRSFKMRFWGEYVRALEALANLSCFRGRKKTALKQYQSALAECKKYRISDAVPRIVLNLAQLLRLLGRAVKARQLLMKYADSAIDRFLLPKFHSALAEVCKETRRFEDARKHWKLAIQSAEAIGNQDEIAFCKSQYAEFEREQDKPDVAAKELESLLRAELSPEDRGTTLKQLFVVLLQENATARATQVFDLAQEHLRKYGFYVQLIDVYMSAFDYNWNGNRKSRLIALQAYVGAFVTALQSDNSVEHLGTIMIHVSQKLTNRATAPSLLQLAWLNTEFTAWLSSQLAPDHALISSLAMPLRYAARVIPCNDNPTKMLVEHECFYREFNEST